MKLLVILFLVSVMFSCGNQDISKEHLSKDVGYLYYRKDVYIGNCHYAIISIYDRALGVINITLDSLQTDYYKNLKVK